MSKQLESKDSSQKERKHLAPTIISAVDDLADQVPSKASDELRGAQEDRTKDRRAAHSQPGNSP